VIACGHNSKPSETLLQGPYEPLEVTDKQQIINLVKKYNVDTIFHMAAILSARSEEIPDVAFNVNLLALKNVLDIARDMKLYRVLWTSSIAAFGPTSPTRNAPQHTILEPVGIYGVCKVAGELLCQYYHRKWGVDVRSLRFPGIISSDVLPNPGGSTSFATRMFHEALQNKKYECYLRADSELVFMYMPDAIKAALTIMAAPPEKVVVRMAYNVAAFPVIPHQLAEEIKKFVPEFEISYKIDELRQKIVDSVPSSLDDSEAKKDWGWNPDYNLSKMAADMLHKLKAKYAIK